MQLVEKEGGSPEHLQMYQWVSRSELLGYLRNLKERPHITNELLGPELRAGNREKIFLYYSFMLHKEIVIHFMHI